MVGRWTDRQILSFHSNSVKRYHKPWCTHENRIRELKFCKVTQLEKDSWQTGSGGGGTESEARALSAVSGQVPKEPWLCQGKAKVTGLGSSPIQSSCGSKANAWAALPEGHRARAAVPGWEQVFSFTRRPWQLLHCPKQLGLDALALRKTQ